MLSLELTFLLLVPPAAAWALGSTKIAVAYSDLKARPPDASKPVLPGRIGTFFAIALIPTIFGLVPWFLVAGLEERFGALNGLPASVLFWAALSFAIAAVVVVGTETMISASRLRQYVSTDFGRVLPIAVIPETAVIFSLILVFLAFGIIDGYLGGTQYLVADRAARIVSAFQMYALTTFALPVAAYFSNRVREFSAVREWARALYTMDIGAAIPIVGFAWAFFQFRP